MSDPADHSRAIWPEGMIGAENPLKISPGVLAGDFLFVTGMTGSAPDGSMPRDPAEQFDHAFQKIGEVLDAAGLGFADVVEMTSYHVEIKRYFDVFTEVRNRYVLPPYPAWTAVGVAELRREGALVEVKVIARR